jgi:methylenetetrahydrofolate--tRNA-(uracil-5-)-methyltransferase
MVKIIGAGLAGVEAAYYLANKNVQVKLYEMRPKKMTPAHQTGDFAELVCSNSLRSNDILNAVGLLKYEMEQFDSIIIKAAKYAMVPAGSSLAVDRTLFSDYIKKEILGNPNIEVIYDEVEEINADELTIICAGPLASDALSKSIKKLFNQEHLHFFDAVAPIIDANSINMDIAYLKSRYDKGEAAYINCPMTKEQYDAFYQAILESKEVFIKDFENNVFEGCMPFEVMAKRGYETLLYGPMKPVGLEKDGKRAFAVVQLRQDDASKSMYNIVGFQTHLTFDSQKKVISLIPGLENAKILRYGVMHRNTYLESPKILNASYQALDYPNLFFAGQMSGVEGYVESAASGLNAAIQVKRLIDKKELKPLPIDTMIGAMARYISTPNRQFVPMNANLGLFLPLDIRHKKKERKELYVKRSIEALKLYMEEL